MLLTTRPSDVFTIQALNDDGNEWNMTVKSCDLRSAIETFRDAGYDDITIAGGWHTWP